MKAVRYHGGGRISVDIVPDPTPGFGEVLLAPEAVGVCGTDTHIVCGEFPSRPPMVLGHEISARVVALGEGADAVAVGDLVTVEPHIYCGVCFNCQTGTKHMCPDRQAPGVHLDGGMAELLVVPQTLAFRLPDGTPATHGALTEPIACCVHGMDRLNVRSGFPFLIFGCGPAGVIMIALARLAGLQPVVGVDTRPSRRDLAQRFGADVVLDPHADDFTERAMALTGGVGFPYVVDAVGSAEVVETAVSLASRGGNILVFGVARPDAVARVRPNEIYARELSLLGTALNPDTHRRAIALLERLPLDQLQIATYGLDDVEKALRAQQEGIVDKVFISPQAGQEVSIS